MEDLESLRALLAFKGNYHNHKETMAHAAIAIQIGILTVLLTMEQQPVWLNCFSQKLLFAVIYLAIWSVITFYMCWQLRNRKIAAKQVDILIKSIRGKIKDDRLKVVIDAMRDKGKLKIGEYILWIADFAVLIIILLKVWVL